MLPKLVFEVLMGNLDKKSKFFKDDSLALKKRVSEKTEEELEEYIRRQEEGDDEE